MRTYLQEQADALPICAWLNNGAYRVDNTDGRTVARYIMGDRGIVWSCVYAPYASMSDAFLDIEFGVLDVFRLDHEGQDMVRAVQIDATREEK